MTVRSLVVVGDGDLLKRCRNDVETIVSKRSCRNDVETMSKRRRNDVETMSKRCRNDVVVSGRAVYYDRGRGGGGGGKAEKRRESNHIVLLGFMP